MICIQIVFHQIITYSMPIITLLKNMRFASTCIPLSNLSFTKVSNACVAVLFVSTITTCGVRGNQLPLEGESLEFSANVSSLQITKNYKISN